VELPEDWTVLFKFLKIGANVEGGSFWMPPQASTVAANTDALFYFIYYLCLIFFVLIVGAMIYFVVKFRKKEGQPEKSSDLRGNHTLEIIWSVVPGILLIVIFAWGFKDWVKKVIPPNNTLDVKVTGQKWNWAFDYSLSGVNSSNLVVPEGTPVRLTMISKDVLHSFFVPAFRVKRDVLPGRYSVMWFEPTQKGEFPVLCTEYCGTSHSEMLSKVKVVSKEEFDQWIADGGDLGGAGVPPAELGAKLYEAKGCNACHSIDGSRKVGPSFKGVYGRSVSYADGSSGTSDENYIRQSILEPNAKVVQGYAPVMPSYQGQLNEKQITAIIEYMKTLK
jgi:cytochrome c oxidase subunit II